MRIEARALLLAFGAAATLAHAAAAMRVEDLMSQLRRERPSAARFNETKSIALLDHPLESSGELLFTPPRRLEKRTTSPGSERLVVDGDALTIEHAGRTQTLSLRELPQVAAILEGIRATLAGDGATLERLYRVRVEGDKGSWHLTLVPRDAEVAKVVARVILGGSGGDVRRVEIEQADGDRSLMQIAPAPR